MLTGAYRDVVRASDGLLVADSGWRPNTIAYQAWTLIADLVRGEPELRGLQFCAVGAGNEAWDAALPRPDPAASGLASEVARVALAPERIKRVDGFGRSTTSLTTRLEAEATFETQEPRILREFGLFGGDASEAANSGRLVNHVIHAAVILTPGDTLTRRVRLSFRPTRLQTRGGAAIVERFVVGSPIGRLPAAAVDGVGPKAAKALENADVATVDDVARMGEGDVADLTATQFLELRNKARLAVGTAARLPVLEPVESIRIGELIDADAVNLSEGTGLPLDIVQELQEQLGILGIALDARRLRRMTIAETR